MDKKCQKRTLFENFIHFNQPISPDVQGEIKNLLVDLASVEKTSATIREEKIKNKSEKKIFFSKNSQFFSGNSEVRGDKKKVVEKYIFEKCSRMVAVIFSADAKSTSRILVSLLKYGDINWLNFFKKSTFLTFFIHICSNLS